MDPASNVGPGSADAAAEKPANGRNKCAACKYQRRRCAEDCALHPYFPADRTHQFLAAHAVFGVKNMTHMLAGIPLPDDRRKAVDSFVWEAAAWKDDPVNGPLGLYRKLQRETELLKSQLLDAKRQLETAPFGGQNVVSNGAGYVGLLQQGEDGNNSVDNRFGQMGLLSNHGQGLLYRNNHDYINRPCVVMNPNFQRPGYGIESSEVRPLMAEYGGGGRGRFDLMNDGGRSSYSRYQSGWGWDHQGPMSIPSYNPGIQGQILYKDDAIVSTAEDSKSSCIQDE